MDNMNWNYPTPIWFGLNRVNETQKACENLNINNPLIKYKEDESVLSSQFVKIIDEKIINDGLYIEFFETGIVNSSHI